MTAFLIQLRTRRNHAVLTVCMTDRVWNPRLELDASTPEIDRKTIAQILDELFVELDQRAGEGRVRGGTCASSMET